MKNFDVLMLRSVLSKLGLNFFKNAVVLPSSFAFSLTLEEEGERGREGGGGGGTHVDMQ